MNIITKYTVSISFFALFGIKHARLTSMNWIDELQIDKLNSTKCSLNNNNNNNDEADNDENINILYSAVFILSHSNKLWKRN